jgi:ferric-dicitrate binding protein FerR (iron transport regulator)
MKENNHIDESILLDYILGRCTGARREEVDLWLKADPGNPAQLEALTRLWQETGKLTPAPAAFDTDTAWKKVSARIAAKEEASVKSPRLTFGRSRALYYAMALAATLLFFAGIASLIRWMAREPSDLMLFAIHQPVSDTLPDGSVVQLNKGSWISYNEALFLKNRSLKFYGEGFFKVMRDTTSPFTVSGENSGVKVLGTAFSFRSRAMNPSAVCVTEGKVEFRNLMTGEKGTFAVLEAGNKGVLDKDTTSAPIVSLMQGNEIFWNGHRLVFRDRPLGEVIPILEKAYGVHIAVSEEPVLSCRLTAAFAEETAGPVLDVIASTFSLQLENRDGTWYLKGNGCAQ